jgi:Protein of unknown function (DUF2796)
VPEQEVIVQPWFVIVSAVLVTAAAVAADQPAAGQPPAHQHGTARLQVSLEGRALLIGYEGPAENILGFEHAPKTDAQKKAVSRAEEQLKQPDRLFVIPAAADCRAQPTRVEVKLPAAGSGETHSEIETEWRWECAKPEALTHVDVGLFKAFPRLKQLSAQVVTTQGQKTAVLKPNTVRLKIAA